MFPAITEIVLIEEGGALLRRDVSQANQSIILVEIIILWTRLTIVRAFVCARHNKLVEMRMRPAHCDLQNMVQLTQRQLPRHDNPSPDRWLNLCQANRERCDFTRILATSALIYFNLLLAHYPSQTVFES